MTTLTLSPDTPRTASDAAKQLCLRSLEAMRTGRLADFEAVFHPDALNYEMKDEPPAARGRGPGLGPVVSAWLRGAYAELDWRVHEIIAQDDLVVLHCTMTGRQTGTFVGYDEHGRPSEAFPATGRSFASTQSHWFRMADGLILEHWANRDDLGSAEQLGWVPPSPAFLVRSALALRRARRAERGTYPVPAPELPPWPTADLDALGPGAAVALRSMQVMRGAPLSAYEAVVHPDSYNREQVDEPPAARGRGPATYHATSRWLRDAFSDLDWTIHSVVEEGDLVAVHCTMSGRHDGTMVVYDGDARPKQAFPPTGRRFATTQTHWLRIADGKVIEHWANRDDLGTALQLGWVPPTPRYLARMALATRRARRGAEAH